jgi:plastocyanin
MIRTTPGMHRVLAGALAAIAVVGLMCRTNPAVAGPRDREEPAAVIVISDAPGEFMPRTMTIRVGDTVEWKNTGGIANSVEFVGEVFPQGTASSPSGLMAPQKNYSFTFTAPGSYAYICRFHLINGLIGKIIVVPDQPASGTTHRS